MKEETQARLKEITKSDSNGEYYSCPECEDELHMKTDGSILVCYNCKFSLTLEEA